MKRLSHLIGRGVKYLTDEDYRFLVNSGKGLCDSMPDEEYLKRMFKAKMGRELDLGNPQTFNEKLQWLKLYDRKSIYTTMVDKYAVKKYVGDLIGEQYIIPTLGVWDRFEDIDFNALPNQFVLKCTHDSGGLVICKDKAKLDIAAAKEKINRSLKRNFYYLWREWPYKDVKPRIIAEKYMEDTGLQELRDYKLYCFDGEMKMVMINSDRKSAGGTRADYFDRQFNYLDFTWGYKHADTPPKKPENFECMVKLAEQLSVGLKHVRVDLYNCDGQIYFGELTFFDGSGFDSIDPIEWDYEIGNWLNLRK